MFEHKKQPLISREEFLKRQVRSLEHTLTILAGALGLGVLGYHFFEGLDWIDALLNASMILGGMGPVDRPLAVAGKLFASFYALFSGLLFLAAAGVLVAPLAHRFFHRFHLESAARKNGRR